MQKSNIEWTEYTSNPVKGECPVGCPYCYVKAFRKRYGWPSEITFNPYELGAIAKRKKPTRIFMGSTIELFHEKTIKYMPTILTTVRQCSQHTFMFLTKQPQNLPRFSPFPDNCWVGVSVCNQAMLEKSITHLMAIDAKIRYISLEPLQEHINLGYISVNDLTDINALSGYIYRHPPLTSFNRIDRKINWIIIGACTGTLQDLKPLAERYPALTLMPYGKKWTLQPPIEWVKEIVEAADRVGVKVFLKDNLYTLITHSKPLEGNYWTKEFKLRQEMPNG